MKCLRGIKALVIRSKESSDPELFEGRGSLLPSTGCGFSPWQDSFTHRNARSAFHSSAVRSYKTHMGPPMESLQFIHTSCYNKHTLLFSFSCPPSVLGGHSKISRMDPDCGAILQKTAQYETTWSSCLSWQEFQTKGKSTHTTTGDSISHLSAQLVRSQFVPEQKPQPCGSHTRRTVCAAESLLKELPQP